MKEKQAALKGGLNDQEINGASDGNAGLSAFEIYFCRACSTFPDTGCECLKLIRIYRGYL